MQGSAWMILLAVAPLACAPCPKTAASPTGASAGAPATSASEPGIEVKVDSDGRAYVGGAPAYKSEDFARAVAEQKRARPTDSATIYADAKVPHGRVVAVKKELEQAGILHVSFALAGEPHPEPPPATPVASTTAEPPPAPPPPAPPPSAEPLPEVKVESFGLHIGGGPNDDATKKPILDAISKHFDAFRACYVKVQDPAKGGTFGVDLRIGRDGGSAKVEQPRTGMKGPEFRECVLDVFKHVTFEKPPKGPTVVSYSLKFSLSK
jgi:biopolymer transport protein ExbD